MPKDTEYKKSADLSTGGEKPFEFSQSPVDVKLGQLEVSLAAFKEKMDGERTLRFWIVGIIFTAIAGVAGGVTFYQSITKDYLESYKNLQKEYYQTSVQNSVIFNKIQSCSVANYYWQFKDCLSK